MKRISLTKGKFALVDDEDYAVLNQYKWYAMKNWNTFYATRTLSGITVSMHREVLGLQKGDGKVTDHIDHDGLNNQRSNLRVCTIQQNCMNQRKAKNKSSIYKGVCLDKQRNKWRVEILFSNKYIYLGSFDSEIKAAEAYDKKAKELFGDFAKTNKELITCTQ